MADTTELVLCGADMGDGVTCQRPLTVRQDPLEWRCGWGHSWWPSIAGGRVRFAGLGIRRGLDGLYHRGGAEHDERVVDV